MSGRTGSSILLAALLFLLAVVAVWSLGVGGAGVSPREALRLLFSGGDQYEAVVVTTIRLPRTLAAISTGAALAVAGALMQAMTNNPLASPGLLGVNAGAAFAVVAAISLFGPMAGANYAWAAFAGAGIAGLCVYGLGSMGTGGATPLRLALAGVIFSSFVASLTAALLLFDKATLDVARMWTVGSLRGRQMDIVVPLSLYIAVGLTAALAIARQVTTLSLGDDLASSLGMNLLVWRLGCGALVIVLAGSAVAIGGPIGFVGLVVPHMARMTGGHDYRGILPLSAAGGALLVLAADTLIRAIIPGTDIPVGVTMALIGAPFFILLARNSRLSAA